MAIDRVTVLSILFHIVAVLGSMFLDNLTSATGLAHYGGESGLLPDSSGPYGAIYNFIAGDNQPELTEQGAGFLGFVKWIFTGPLGLFGDLVGLLLVISTFSYPIINIIPAEGFGLWFRILVHGVSLLLLAILVSRLLEWASRNGLLSNPYLLVAMSLIGSIGLISHGFGG